MPDYTEAAIHELDGAELNAAVHQIVLEDDLTANTDERLDSACQSWAWSKVNTSLFDRDNPAWFGRSGYENRHGQPWQADLESHVAAYRAKPWEQDPMDLNWCWKRLMREYWELVQMRDYVRCRSIVEGVEAKGDDPETAIKRAACIVAMRKRGES